MFFVELFQQGDVDLEFLVVVADVDEGPEEFVREDQLESLAVLLHRVEEPQEAQAQDLDLVLGLRVFYRVLTLSMWVSNYSLRDRKSVV